MNLSPHVLGYPPPSGHSPADLAVAMEAIPAVATETFLVALEVTLVSFEARGNRQTKGTVKRGF